MFGQVGSLEIVVVLIIALVVLGPKRLPEVARSVGRGVRELREAMSGAEHDDDDEEAPDRITEPDRTPEPDRTTAEEPDRTTAEEPDRTTAEEPDRTTAEKRPGALP